MFDQKLTTLAENTLLLARNKGWVIATAESCTGGLISALLTEIAGSSDVFDRGFATYSNDAKMDCLGVPSQTLIEHGAVSTKTAEAMASGVIKNSNADISIVTTGIAGPGGATEGKPVGLVHFAISFKQSSKTIAFHHVFKGNRSEVRYQACITALETLSEHLNP